MALNQTVLFGQLSPGRDSWLRPFVRTSRFPLQSPLPRRPSPKRVCVLMNLTSFFFFFCIIFIGNIKTSLESILKVFQRSRWAMFGTHDYELGWPHSVQQHLSTEPELPSAGEAGSLVSFLSAQERVTGAPGLQGAQC